MAYLQDPSLGSFASEAAIRESPADAEETGEASFTIRQSGQLHTVTIRFRCSLSNSNAL
jgi:hypothetical protein